MSETERLKDLLQVTNVGIDWMNRALDAEKRLAEFSTLHPASSWTEAEGPVLWWFMEGGEARCLGEYECSPRATRGYWWSKRPKVELPVGQREGE